MTKLQIPSPKHAEEFDIDVFGYHGEPCDRYIFASSYAAAVSKNLQEERDKLKAELDLVDEALARRPALADIEHRYNKIFAACAGAAKSERLEKQLKALREKVMD